MAKGTQVPRVFQWGQHIKKWGWGSRWSRFRCPEKHNEVGVLVDQVRGLKGFFVDDRKVLVFCWFWHPRLTPDPCDKLPCIGRLMQVLNQGTSRGFEDENMLIGEIISTLSS